MLENGLHLKMHAIVGEVVAIALEFIGVIAIDVAINLLGAYAIWARHGVAIALKITKKYVLWWWSRGPGSSSLFATYRLKARRPAPRKAMGILTGMYIRYMEALIRRVFLSMSCLRTYSSIDRTAGA